MRQFVYSLMTDGRRGFPYAPFKCALYIASLLYGLGIFLRRLLYKAGVFRTARPLLKVISVGNLTLGGTGKTPFVITLARILKDELKKEVCVLIRGYGWDEQTMLRRNMDDIPLLVGENRAKSCGRALRLYGSDTAVLDDGFQHWEVARDLDIVLVDSRNPFGNNRLFPRGILREPKGAAGRAHIAVFTKVNKKISDPDAIKEDIMRFNSGIVFLEAVHRPKHLFDMKSRSVIGLEFARGKKVILVSSIGDPGYFEETAGDIGAEVLAHIKFPDHHDYRMKDIARVTRICDERNFDFILTTEKDAVKLNRLALTIGEYRVITLAVAMEITKGREELIAGLRGLYTDKGGK